MLLGCNESVRQGCYTMFLDVCNVDRFNLGGDMKCNYVRLITVIVLLYGSPVVVYFLTQSFLYPVLWFLVSVLGLYSFSRLNPHMYHKLLMGYSDGDLFGDKDKR